jgi:CO dehydrogenase maturation factor
MVGSMKLAIAGKGGAGKTTISGTLARQLARQGYGVLALDNDLNPNLPLTVGIPAERMIDMPTLDADVAHVVDGRLELARTMEEIQAAHAMEAPDGVTVLVAHEPKKADTGCMGRYHMAMRAVVGGAENSQNYIVILDTEASTEHLKVGTAKHVDVLYAVVEPYYKSLESGRRVLALARDLGIEHLALLANKVRPGELEIVEEFAREHDLGVIGSIPFDECFYHAERAAVAPIDYAPDAPAVVAIGKLARKLVRG